MDAIEIARDILGSAPEINPSNYDHDQVCQLNAAANEAYGILDKALAAAGWAAAPVAEELSGEPVAWRYRVKGYGWELFDSCPFSGTDISPGPKEELEPLYTHPQPAVPDVDALAQHIRKINSPTLLGAWAMAEQIVEWLEVQQ